LFSPLTLILSPRGEGTKRMPFTPLSYGSCGQSNVFVSSFDMSPEPFWSGASFATDNDERIVESSDEITSS
ncbi:MAG: hypothetical protein ACE5KJ_05405, partial [Candidatus Zixiibacteriota bacterium]